MTFLNLCLLAFIHIVSFLVFSTLIYIGWNLGFAVLYEGLSTISWLQACAIKLCIIGIRYTTLISLDFKEN